MLTLWRILRDRERGERGIALAIVIGVAGVLLVTTLTALTFSVGAVVKAGATTDSDAAAAAAYAGVSDYQSRLTNDNTYVRYGDSTAPFSAQTGSTTLILPTPNSDGSPANPAFGYGATGTWAPEPGASDNTAFRYEVDNSDYASEGVIRLLATGRSGKQTRSILADLNQKGFLQFLYFTNYETQDPTISGGTIANCQKYYSAGRVDSNCGGAIQFSPGELVNGPVDSNDAMLICGGDFVGKVTTNYTPTSGTQFYRTDACSSSNPTFEKGAPVHGDLLQPPPTNQAMPQETRADLTTTSVPRPGCLYTGPTSIVFNGNGTMTVRSPWTKYTNTGINTTTGLAYGMVNPISSNYCGTASAAGLWSAAGQTIPVPTQNLIFVQTVPSYTAAAPSSDPNAWLSGTYPTVNGYAACPSNGNDLGYPINTSTVSGTQTTTVVEDVTSSKAAGGYGCQSGDAFVSGTVSGQVTVASDHFVWITGNLTYANPSTDVLGLVAQNAVFVWNPYVTTTVKKTSNGSVVSTGTGSYLPTTAIPDATIPDGSGTTGRIIDAAIMSVSHTFQVQNYDKGALRGGLWVVGAIAQNFRGTVGLVGSSGYAKKYNYDWRFVNIAPPKFLQAVSTTYGVTQFADVPAAFNWDGSSR